MSSLRVAAPVGAAAGVRFESAPVAAPELPGVLPGGPAAASPTRHVLRLDSRSRGVLATTALERGTTPHLLVCAVFAATVAEWARPAPFAIGVDDAGATRVVSWDAGPEGFAGGVRGLGKQWDERGTAPAEVLPVVFAVGAPTDGPPTDDLPAGVLVRCAPTTSDCAEIQWSADAGRLAPGIADDAFAVFEAALRRTLAEPARFDHPASPARLPDAHQDAYERLNATGAPVPTGLIHEAVAAAAAANPDRLAVIAADRTLDYAELLSRARRIGRALRLLGVRRDDLVALALDKGWQQVVAMTGVSESGGAWVSIAPELPAKRREQLFAASGASVVLTSRALADTLGPYPDGTVVLAVDDDDAWSGHDDGPLPAVGEPGDLAYVIFTSGSTGRPKGVMIEHRGALNTIADVNNRFELRPDDVTFAVSAWSFDLSLWDVFGALTTGAAVVVPAPGTERDPAHWATLIHRHQVTVWNSAPALFELLCEHAERDAPHAAATLRLVLLGGDWISLALPGRAERLAPGCLFVSTGGATEGSIWSIMHPVVDLDPTRPSIPYGRPLANQSAHILDADLRPRPLWVPGDLFLGGTGVARGYWRDPDRTAASFVTDPRTGERLYRTGDLARLLPDGTIEFLGRVDFQVQLRGHRIELGEIETTLMAHPQVAAAAVTALLDPHGPGYHALAAYALPAPGTAPTPDELRTHLAERLPAYMVPATIDVLDTMPLNTSGKVDRGALPAPRAGRPAVYTVAAAPIEGATARLVASVWADVLGVDHVGVGDGFFALGGDSLGAIRATNRLREVLRCHVALADVLSTETLADLADLLDRRRADLDPERPFEGLPAIVPAPADERYDPFPLTDQQQAYCLGRTDAFASGGVSAHLYQEYEGVGVDLDRLTAAWLRVVDRHDMLRAVVSPDELTQRVLPHVPPYRIAVNDLRGHGADPVDEGLARVRARLSHEVRPADRWPLFTIEAVLLDGDRTRVCVSVDALLADFISLRVLLDDLGLFYRDPHARPDPVPLSYRDYVLATTGLVGSGLHERSRAYWWSRLDTLPPAPELPRLRRVVDDGVPRFTRRAAMLEATAWTRLKEQASATNLTSSGILLACYAEILAAWSASSRFTVNVPSQNRLPVHPDIDSVVGEFASFTLLEVDHAGADPFAVRARRIQERLWQDLEHQYVSGVEVLRELRRRRGGVDQALMPVVLTSTTAIPVAEHTLLDGLLRPVFSVSQTPQVWMDLVIEERAGDLCLHWDTVDGRFPDGLVDDMFVAFTDLLRLLAGEPAAWERADVLPLPARQARTRRAVAGRSKAIPDEPAHAALVRRARAYPNDPAVFATDGTLTHGELLARAEAIARVLAEHGARPGRLVGVVVEPGIAQVIAPFAVLLTGAAYLPIDAGLPVERLHHVLDRGDVDVVVTAARLDATLSWPERVRVRVCADRVQPAAPPLPAECVAGPDDLAYVLFTSGSTGLPKGVMIEHRGLVNALTETNERFGVGPGDRCLALTAAHHDMSVFDLFGALGAGAAIVLPDPRERRDAAHWVDLMTRHRVTVWNSVPAMLEMLLDHLGEHAVGHDALRELRLAFLGGDWIPGALASWLATAAPNARLVSVGGPTETTLWNIWYPVTDIDPQWPNVPYGRAIANTTYRVLDAQARDRPEWVTGEMYCAGPGVARGYWRDPERTAAVFGPHPVTGERLYRTGDLGRFRPDGTIEFMGRADFQVKIRGQRIELGEVEAALRAAPGVRAAVAAGVPYPDRPGYRALAAYAVVEPGTDAAELRAHLGRSLPAHMVPATVTILPVLPLTANGKVDRRALPRPDAGQAELAETDRPTDDLLVLLCELWAQVLGLEQVGPRENFFVLGGDSILATRIVARLRETFPDSEPNLRMLFTGSTVVALADALEATESRSGSTRRIARVHRRVAALSEAEVADALRARS
jgi:yersiniabactin nonribosomal peptide synthetase